MERRSFLAAVVSAVLAPLAFTRGLCPRRHRKLYWVVASGGWNDPQS